ncbi:transcription factor ILR3-like isoform X2 [Aristolochia californica]|uniref:transcription factor ILR3-like isoform X2 n=1 Tax=Aristolochia californica TaxID=171875 RepID=UPI0035E1B4D6
MKCKLLISSGLRLSTIKLLKGVGLHILVKENSCSDKQSSRKRTRMESRAGLGTKACREKMRRDRLNDRFVELCSILNPGRPSKTDKAIILSDASRLLNQLRVEAQKLKETNEALLDTIKNLKAEKMELRDEKVRLKAEKEKMEQLLKGMSVPSPFMPHPAAAFHAAAAAFHAAAAAFATNNKGIPFANYPPIAMWQWMPPASLDTSQDHVLRPPVA